MVGEKKIEMKGTKRIFTKTFLPYQEEYEEKNRERKEKKQDKNNNIQHFARKTHSIAVKEII